MGHFKKEDTINKEQELTNPEEYYDLEYDHKLSTKHQLIFLEKWLRELTVFKATFEHPITAWDAVHHAVSLVLDRDEYQACDKGTYGCITRHKRYDECSDDPSTSN